MKKLIQIMNAIRLNIFIKPFQEFTYTIIYRIESHFYNKNQKNTLLKIRVIGKDSIMIKEVLEVANDDNLIKGFDPRDARTIGYLAAYEKIKNKDHQ